MIFLGLVLLSLGATDLVAGSLSGEPRSARSVILGGAVASVLTVAGAWLSGLAGSRSMLFVLLTSGGTICWLGLRVTSAGRPPEPQQLRAALFLWALLLAVTVGWFWTWPVELHETLVRYAGYFVPGAHSSLAVERTVLLVGILVALVATSNAIVRAVLQLAAPSFRQSEKTVRGGRVIGALERTLVFSLAISGEPLAAAVIVSAKGLLRFPELSRADHDISAITEYLVLGSLLSWFLALAPAMLFLWATSGGAS